MNTNIRTQHAAPMRDSSRVLCVAKKVKKRDSITNQRFRIRWSLCSQCTLTVRDAAKIRRNFLLDVAACRTRTHPMAHRLARLHCCASSPWNMALKQPSSPTIRHALKKARTQVMAPDENGGNAAEANALPDTDDADADAQMVGRAAKKAK